MAQGTTRGSWPCGGALAARPNRADGPSIANLRRMRSFHTALRGVLLGSMAASLPACSDEGVDTTGLDPLVCAPASEPLAGVSSRVPADYVELRDTGSGVEPVKTSRGERCANARDRTACEADYAAVEARDDDSISFGQSFQRAGRSLVVVTDVDGVHVFRRSAELAAWIAPIDTRADAVLAASLNGYNVACGESESSGITEAANGYRLIATRTTKDCDPVETTQYLLSIDATGAVRPLESEVIESRSGVCIGRRPEGLRPYRCGAGEAVGRWLADVAYLEAASVASFDRLATELRRFGAPEALVAEAERARRDEIRHAAAMRRLAARHGASPATPAPLTFHARSLEDFARENAVEGCTLETFGALVGLAQAETAADADVRRVMHGIARDEARHGELAWRVHHWALAQLDEAARSASAAPPPMPRTSSARTAPSSSTPPPRAPSASRPGRRGARSRGHSSTRSRASPARPRQRDAVWDARRTTIAIHALVSTSGNKRYAASPTLRSAGLPWIDGDNWYGSPA